MKIVLYETENGIFQFNLSDVINRLTFYVNEHNVDEAKEIISFLSSSSDNPIKISEDDNYFQFICLNLINENKGNVTCKICRKTYLPNQLKIIRRECGQNLSSTKEKQYGWSRFIKWIKRIFSKGQKQRIKQRIGNFGWKKIECEKDHELIPMVITWIS